MKHIKVVMSPNGQCEEAGLIETDIGAQLKEPYINIWYHHSDKEESAIKLFKMCDKAPEMYEALIEAKNEFIYHAWDHEASIVKKLDSLLKEIEDEN
jgi:hypothetical protein